jgi:hypothetical protein
LLIAASLLKARQFIADPYGPSDLPNSHFIRVAVIDYELVLGFWLITGLLSRFAWTTAIITFAIFLAINIRDAFIGKASCSCFGNLLTSPWLVASIDFFVIISLVGLFPKVLPRNRIVNICSVLLLLATSIPATIGILQTNKPPRVVATPEVLDLGKTLPGSSTTSDFILHNDGPELIDIESLETSCHCLTVHLPIRTIQPGQQVKGEIVFAPEVGSASQTLLMSVHGYDTKKKILFTVTVKASL